MQPGSNGGVDILVQDDGPGISPELREKVFERFYQASQGDSREYEGLGVGLTIARAVFQSLKGNVEILDSPTGMSACTHSSLTMGLKTLFMDEKTIPSTKTWQEAETLR